MRMSSFVGVDHGLGIIGEYLNNSLIDKNPKNSLLIHWNIQGG